MSAIEILRSKLETVTSQLMQTNDDLNRLRNLAFERHLEVTGSLMKLAGRIDALESAAREPAGAEEATKSCLRCAHQFKAHHLRLDADHHEACAAFGCHCTMFIPAPEPHGEAIDPAIAHCQSLVRLGREYLTRLDPILLLIAEIYRDEIAHETPFEKPLLDLRNAWRAYIGKSSHIDVESDILNYGVTS